MNNYMTVFGITPIQCNQVRWQDYWELEYWNDTEMFFKSKTIYEYNYPEGDIPAFKYYFVLYLQILELDDYSEILQSEILLIPTIQHIHESIIKNIIKQYESIDINDIMTPDLINEGLFPILVQESPNFNYNVFDEDDEQIQQYLLSTSIAIECIDIRLGFHLDKIVNQLGTTNWELLECIFNGGNPFQKTLNRVCKKMKEGEQ